MAGLWRSDAVYEITLNNQTRLSYDVPEGDQITDGDQVIVTDTTGNRVVFEYDNPVDGLPGVSGPLALTIPPSATLVSLDDTTFDVDVGGNSVTFRYTTDPNLISPDQLITLSATDTTTSQIAAKTADAIATAFPTAM